MEEKIPKSEKGFHLKFENRRDIDKDEVFIQNLFKQ